MKGSCLQETMQRALQITSRVTPGRTPMPIIQNTLIRMMEKAVEFTATNLEMTVRMRIPADVEREGALTVPNKLLSDLVHTLPKEPVSMEQTEETAVMRIRCGSAKANINGTNADLFPSIPEVEENNAVVITAEEFRKAVARVAFCAATDNGRPVLTGVLLELDGETLTTVGADGFRLGLQRSSLEKPPSENTRAIVPARTLLEVQRIAGNAERQVEIMIPASGNNIRFLVGSEEPGVTEVEITSLLVAGNYPAYETLIPQGLPNRAVFSLGDLSRTARRAEIFARDPNHTVRFEISRRHGETGNAVISSETKELGDNRAELNVQEMQGSDISIALNGKYIQEALASLDSKQVTLETSNGSSPAKMRIPGDESYVHVMMPIVTLEDK